MRKAAWVSPMYTCTPTCVKYVVDFLGVRVETVDKFVVLWSEYLPRLNPNSNPGRVG